MTTFNDWGGYDYNVRLADLQSQGGIDIFISQAGGLGTPKLLAQAHTLGMGTGEYCWNSAINSAQYQIDYFSKIIDADKPDFIILDFEHWWAVWSEYWEAIAGTRPWANVTKLSPQKISDNAQAVCEGINQRWAGKYYLNYSAAWFINGYSPQSATWLKKYPFHVAAYPDYGNVPYTLTWDQIKAEQMQAYHVTGLQYVKDWKPTLPTGMTDWAIWQYSSRIKIPGEYYAYDWNYIPGTLDDFKRLIGMLPPVPEPTDAEKLTILWADYKTRQGA